MILRLKKEYFSLIVKNGQMLVMKRKSYYYLYLIYII
jgi:hypothetical protein